MTVTREGQRRRCSSRSPPACQLRFNRDVPEDADSAPAERRGAGRAAQPLQGVRRQAAADREHREPLWLHRAVRRSRGALPEIPRARPGGGRLPVGRFPSGGRERGRGRRGLLRELRGEVPDAGAVGRDRRQGEPGVPRAGAPDEGTALELQQISGGRRRQGGRLLRQHGGARFDEEGRKGAPLSRAAAS